MRTRRASYQDALNRFVIPTLRPPTKTNVKTPIMKMNDVDRLRESRGLAHEAIINTGGKLRTFNASACESICTLPTIIHDLQAPFSFAYTHFSRHRLSRRSSFTLKITQSIFFKDSSVILISLRRGAPGHLKRRARRFITSFFSRECGLKVPLQPDSRTPYLPAGEVTGL